MRGIHSTPEPRKCSCVFATDHLNYQASFTLVNGTGWICNGCGGVIEPSQMPREFADDAALLVDSGFAAYKAKYAIGAK